MCDGGPRAAHAGPVSAAAAAADAGAVNNADTLRATHTRTHRHTRARTRPEPRTQDAAAATRVHRVRRRAARGLLSWVRACGRGAGGAAGRRSGRWGYREMAPRAQALL